jgi:hypothetical protein
LSEVYLPDPGKAGQEHGLLASCEPKLDCCLQIRQSPKDRAKQRDLRFHKNSKDLGIEGRDRLRSLTQAPQELTGGSVATIARPSEKGSHPDLTQVSSAFRGGITREEGQGHGRIQVSKEKPDSGPVQLKQSGQLIADGDAGLLLRVA